MRTLKFRCASCAMPYVHVYNGVFSVDSRHGGHTHANSIGIGLLLTLLEISSANVDPTSLIRAQESAGITVHEPVRWRAGDWAIPLLCFRRECNAPWAHVVKGAIHVVSYHNREMHYNQVSAETIRVLMGVRT